MKVSMKTQLNNKKKREYIEKIRDSLPTNWIELFIFQYPEYNGKKAHISNVGRGLALWDDETIEKMEALAKKYKQTKKTNK